MAKICDFGLARDINTDCNYVVKGNVSLRRGRVPTWTAFNPLPDLQEQRSSKLLLTHGARGVSEGRPSHTGKLLPAVQKTTGNTELPVDQFRDLSARILLSFFP